MPPLPISRPVPRCRPPAGRLTPAGIGMGIGMLLAVGPGTALAQVRGPDAATATTTATPAPVATASAPVAGTASPVISPGPTSPLPATAPATRPATSITQSPSLGAGTKPTPAARASSGIYRSTGPGGAVRYGAVETPGAMEVTRESIRTRTVTAPPLDGVTPAYRAEVADTCQTWRDRVNAWRTAREIYVREDDGRVRLLSNPERARTVGRFSSVATYWCRPAAAEKIQAEYRISEARRLAAEERAAATAVKVVKVEQR